MGLPETSLGIICGAGGTQRLPRIVGEGAAKEMIFTGQMIDASKALTIGLVNRVVPADQLLEEAFHLAHSIEKNGQIAIKSAKKAVALSSVSSIKEGCLFEREMFSHLFETEDQKIGMKAFLEKEKVTHFKNK